jgi:hypothetical protein
MKLLALTATGVMLLFLTACSTPSSLTLPPEALLADCAHAEKPATRTNGALADWALREKFALDRCNADKAALREWRAGLADTRTGLTAGSK